MSLSIANEKAKLAFQLSLQGYQSSEPEQKEDKFSEHFLDGLTTAAPDIDIGPSRITRSDCNIDDDDVCVQTDSDAAASKRNAHGLPPSPAQRNSLNNDICKIQRRTERNQKIEKAVVCKREKIIPIYSNVRQESKQSHKKIRERKGKNSTLVFSPKHPPYTLISNEQREQIVEEYENGCTMNRICETLQISKLLVERVVCRYRKTGQVTLDEKVSVTKVNLPLDVASSIRLWMNDDCNVSLAQLVEKVWITYSIRVSTNSIALALVGFYYFFNRVQISPKYKNTSTLEQIKQYATEFATLPQRVSEHGTIFLDYGALNVTFRAQTKPYIRQKSIYIICAMNESGLLHYLTRHSHISKNCVKEFVNEVKDKLREQNIDESVMVIGSEAHNRYTKLDDIVGYYKCVAMFLPSNAGYLNPVEYLFKNFKGIVRRANPQSENEMLAGIERVPSLLTATDCKNYFELMWSYVQRCMDEEEISDFTMLG